MIPKYLLMIKKRKWDALSDPWLGSGEVPGDPLGDLRITRGKLSLWYIEKDGSNLDLIVAALAANRERFDKFEYALFEQNIVYKIDLAVEETIGATPLNDANKWHRDLVHLTVDKAAHLVTSIFSTLEKKRVPKNDVRRRVVDAYREGLLYMKQVPPSMREVLSAVQNPTA